MKVKTNNNNNNNYLTLRPRELYELVGKNETNIFDFFRVDYQINCTAVDLCKVTTIAMC